MIVIDDSGCSGGLSKIIALFTIVLVIGFWSAYPVVSILVSLAWIALYVFHKKASGKERKRESYAKTKDEKFLDDFTKL